MDHGNLIIKENARAQVLHVSSNFGKIACPSHMLVSGPTLSGKSQFALKLITFRAKIYSHEFERVLYALPHQSLHLHQEFISQLRSACENIQIIEGLPDIENLHLTANKLHKLLVLDDLMLEAFESTSILNLVTKLSHHANISLVLISQSIFLPAKHRLTLSRNCSEKVIFHDKIDLYQLQIFSRQIFPRFPNFLQECFDYIYQNTKKEDLKYLLIDASPLSDLPPNAVVRTFIFPQKDGRIRPYFFFPTS